MVRADRREIIAAEAHTAHDTRCAWSVIACAYDNQRSVLRWTDESMSGASNSTMDDGDAAAG